MDKSDSNYLVGTLGISLLLGLSAAGSCKGMSLCGTSSVLYSSIPSIITYSYISMIMISTIFFYAFILAIIMMNQLTNEYSFHKSLNHFASSLVFGMISLFAGNSMGKVSKEGFRRIAQQKNFFMSFLISLASIEVTLVIAFLCSLIIIFKN